MWYTILTNWMMKTMILSIDAEKAFDKIQHPFMIKKKNSPESRHRRSIPQHNKGHIWQTHSQCYPQWRKIESFPSKIRNKTKVPTLTITIQHSFGSPKHSSQRSKRNKRNPDWKRRSKTSLFADDMILYIENPKDTSIKLLELINEYRKASGY